MPIAAVVLVIVTVAWLSFGVCWSLVTRSKKYSLRDLFIFVTVVAILLGLFALTRI